MANSELQKQLTTLKNELETLQGISTQMNTAREIAEQASRVALAFSEMETSLGKIPEALKKVPNEVSSASAKWKKLADSQAKEWSEMVSKQEATLSGLVEQIQSKVETVDFQKLEESVAAIQESLKTMSTRLGAMDSGSKERDAELKEILVHTMDEVNASATSIRNLGKEIQTLKASLSDVLAAMDERLSAQSRKINWMGIAILVLQFILITMFFVI